MKGVLLISNLLMVGDRLLLAQSCKNNDTTQDEQNIVEYSEIMSNLLCSYLINHYDEKLVFGDSL